MIQHVDIYVYSGTGNTLIIAEEIQKQFEIYGYRVTLFPIEKVTPDSINPSHINGFGFPIALHLTYPFIIEFFNKIDWHEEMKVFFFSTMGGTKNGVGNYVAKLRKKNTFTFLGNGIFQMPNNLFVKENSDEVNQALIDNCLPLVETFVKEMLDGNTKDIKTDFLSKLWNPFCLTDFSWKMVQKAYQLQIDGEKCIHCGVCSYICPVGNIVLNRIEDRYEFTDKCEICLRCYTYCPKDAIFIKGKEDQKKYVGIPRSKMLKWTGLDERS